MLKLKYLIISVLLSLFFFDGYVNLPRPLKR